jgi:hypothetical protein
MKGDSTHCASRSSGIFQHNDSINAIVLVARSLTTSSSLELMVARVGMRCLRITSQSMTRILAGERPSGSSSDGDNKNDEKEGNE